MHEAGLFERLAKLALDEAAARGAELRGLTVRLGALAAMDEAHFFEHWHEVAPRLGLESLQVLVEEAPDHPAGLELVAIDVAEPRGTPPTESLAPPTEGPRSGTLQRPRAES